MVPLNDENPIRITPIVTYTLIILNVLIFFYELNLTQSQLQNFFQLFAVVPNQLTASFNGANVGQSINCLELQPRGLGLPTPTDF